MRNLIRACVFALAAFAGEAVAQPAAWPAKSIQLVVGFPAGGIVEVMTRALATKMSESLGVQVLTVPTPGAGGILAMQKVARAEADGYTLMMVPTGTLLARPHQMGQPVSYRDFTPIGTAAVASTTISVKVDHRWKTFDDFVREAKQNPGKFAYASPAVGGIPHLGMELVAAATGINVLHVPHPGGQPALMAAVSGQTDLVVGDNTNPQIRALATMMPQRSPFAPDVPTLRELGFDVELPVRFSVVGPKGVPPEVVSRLSAALQAALKAPEVEKLYSAQQLIIRFEDASVLAVSWPKEEARFKQVIDRLGLAEQPKKDAKN